MSEGAGREHWQHTSTILCMLANNNRAKKSDPKYKPEDFDPYVIAERKERSIDPESLALLRESLEAFKVNK